MWERSIPSISDGYIKEDTAEEQAEKTQWLALVTLQEKRAQQEVEEKQRAEERDRNRVFAKSCLRGEGCNDAGKEPEPHTHFATMAFYQAIPPSEAEVPQHAQTAKKKKAVDDIPKPKKRSALYKWLNGDHEEIDYQRAIAAATSAANAQTAVEGASILGLVGGSAITSGTWAVKLGEIVTGLGRIAASGPGAPIGVLVMGMVPGRLNDGEQDYLDRMRLEQMRDAPTRVRYSWEQDDKGNLVPHGWHTPPGKDRVRVRKMAWDSSRNAYTFTTEEEPRITLIWTPDSSGVNVPANTGNPSPVRMPSPVVVDPLPEDSSIDATTTPAPEEKNFADYILILPLSDIPPIYVYLNADHKYYTPPKENPPLPAYPDAKKAQAKTPLKGGGKLRNRWKDSKGKIYEWGSRHGTVEIYDRSGRNHLGEFDPITGEQTKPADPTRKVEK
ncbi:S-type pyocin domain-containing protein [Rosenbergiella nectarea]|uniref:S-type pyocin domain-containing protein n=2 Tax=Rosenbergiella nectarea TaxID=988801 RepID=UPI001F4EA8E2